jgi:transcriptional regulator with XRE-family HTH domain
MTGAELRIERENRKMTHEMFGAFLQVSASAVIKWERGERKIPAHIEDKLRDVARTVSLDGLTPAELAAFDAHAARKGRCRNEMTVHLIRAFLDVCH